MGELHLLQSMVDRQAVRYFLHTPEVPAELQVTAVASANRPYRNWRRTVQRLFRSGTTNGDSAIQLSFDIGARSMRAAHPEQQQRLYAKLCRELGAATLAALGDPDVTEVMCNPDGALWVESHAKGMRDLGLAGATF
jgi:hypothetical protein